MPKPQEKLTTTCQPMAYKIPKYSEFLIVSAPTPISFNDKLDLVEVRRVKNPNFTSENYRYDNCLNLENLNNNFAMGFAAQNGPVAGQPEGQNLPVEPNAMNVPELVQNLGQNLPENRANILPPMPALALPPAANPEPLNPEMLADPAILANLQANLAQTPMGNFNFPVDPNLYDPNMMPAHNLPAEYAKAQNMTGVEPPKEEPAQPVLTTLVPSNRDFSYNEINCEYVSQVPEKDPNF